MAGSPLGGVSMRNISWNISADKQEQEAPMAMRGIGRPDLLYAVAKRRMPLTDTDQAQGRVSQERYDTRGLDNNQASRLI